MSYIIILFGFVVLMIYGLKRFYVNKLKNYERDFNGY